MRKNKKIMLTTNETYILDKIRSCKANMNEVMSAIDNDYTVKSVIKGLLEQIEELKTDLNFSIESRIKEVKDDRV